MSELERVYDAEIVDDTPTLEDLKSEWTAGAETKLRGQLRQARAAYLVDRHYGESSVESFADELRAGRSTVYEYARVYRRLLQFFPSQEEISGRLDESPLTITNVIEASKEEDFPKALDEAEIEGHTTRQQKAKRKERETPKNVETIQRGTCPHCGSVFEARDADLRSEAV